MARHYVAAGLTILSLAFSTPDVAAAAPTAWSGSGPGAISVTSDGTTSDASFHYSLDPAGYDVRTWDFVTVADRSGPVTLEYQYSGLHAWFQVTVFLEATIDGAPVASLAQGGPAICCTAPSNGFTYSGQVTLDVTSGQSYGFRFGGSNFDYNNFLEGDLVVHVVNAPPDCTTAAPSVQVLWPPDHRMVEIGVGGVTDPDGDDVTVSIASIWQDEPVDADGDGATSPDGAGVGNGKAVVRAERSGGGDGRVYFIGFTADDGRGGTCAGLVEVGVPHDRSGAAAGSGGALYDSTAP